MKMPLDRDRRRVVLHVGMPKTGSSALQVAFAANRDRLRARGVWYPPHASDDVASRGGVTSGNGGGALRLFLANTQGAERAAGEKAFRQLLEQVDSSSEPTVLYSSEHLWVFDARAPYLAQMRDALAERGVDLQIAMFVRDVAGHSLSVYSQLVKRHLLTSGFDEFIGMAGRAKRGYHDFTRARIARYVDTVGIENVYVEHYDSVRDHLVKTFFSDVLGFDSLADFDVTTETVNRSLTQTEIEFMRYVNSTGASRDVTIALSDSLMRRPPHGSMTLTITEAERQHLSKMFHNDFRWVNEQFFEGKGRYRVVSPGISVVESRDAVPPLTDRERSILNWFVEFAVPRV